MSVVRSTTFNFGDLAGLAPVSPNWGYSRGFPVDRTDGSYEIARQYAAREPERIRLCQHAEGANHGLSRTANRGLSEAGGDGLAFLDADGTWLPARLKHDVDVLSMHPSIVYIGGMMGCGRRMSTNLAVLWANSGLRNASSIAYGLNTHRAFHALQHSRLGRAYCAR